MAPWRTRPPARHPLARTFPDIVACDSTLVQVADELRPFFNGTRAAAASLKVLLGVSIWGLLPVVARVVSGNQHDMISVPEPSSFRPGSLLLLDKGSVAYARLRELDAASLVRDGAGSPISGVEVTLTCPEAPHDDRTTSTDASGHFEVPAHLGCLEPDCKVSIRAADGKAKDYMVRDHCKDKEFQCGAGCNVVSLDAVL
ncbi:hypothetical protein WME94_35430 [Sorangium sp. So ce429]